MLYHICERNRDLIKAIRREIAASRGQQINIKEVLDRAIHGGAPRFYLDYETAIDGIRRYFNSGIIPARGLRRGQWQEFAGLVRKRMDEVPNLKLSAAVGYVLLECPASGFFLSRRQAYAIYNEHLRFLSYQNCA
ncbi:MAG: hypothetical protein HUK14_03790 [Muribaculaceae bacterium]|nr:hypothetical protein [Muribaculaceae bacterium]